MPTLNSTRWMMNLSLVELEVFSTSNLRRIRRMSSNKHVKHVEM